MRLCWLCGMLVTWTRRHPFACLCRTIWTIGGPPEWRRDNPLGLLDPPEYTP